MTEPKPELDVCLLEGRRAALCEVVRIAAASGWSYTGVKPEQMSISTSGMWVNNINITPVIDAAILETVARLGRRRRPWWRFWR